MLLISLINNYLKQFQCNCECLSIRVCHTNVKQAEKITHSHLILGNGQQTTFVLYILNRFECQFLNPLQLQNVMLPTL